MAKRAFFILTMFATQVFAQVPLTREELQVISKRKVDEWERIMFFDVNLLAWTERFVSGNLPSGDLVLERGSLAKEKIPADTVYAVHMTKELSPLVAEVHLKPMSEVFLATEEEGIYSRRLVRFIFPDGALGLGAWGGRELTRVTENYAVGEYCAHSKLADVKVGDSIKIEGQQHVVQGIFDNDDFLATIYPPRERSPVEVLREAIRVKPNSGYVMDRRLGFCEES